MQEVALPWVEKYRPSSLTDLVAHEDIISVLTKLIDSDKLPHLLLYGPPGTGKTSTIIAMAKKMYGEKKYKGMVLELNASDERGIDVVRNQIREFAGTRQLFSSGTKLILLDECDAMTNDAQFALRRIIEKYSRDTRFCLICNYVSKIIPALQSRCTRFRFAPLASHQIKSRLLEVAAAENVKTTDEGVSAILDLAHGDMRRVMNLLQSTSMAYPLVNESNVYLCSGSPMPNDMETIYNSLLNDNLSTCVDKVGSMSKEKGYALQDIIKDLTTLVLATEIEGEVLGDILDGMSNVEHQLGVGTDEGLQLRALVGVFVKARCDMGA
ncbi:hypothetical protein TrCOL_g38 [Triparma columacea]|uniref:AAA+ ATPase domain-containing protein n=1 Tax=Triparma columacea TaxID=722753 RepID=A0A9W7FY35_9STRA|nr:hypothetical protein TrCOL_g38 [Triparma columacea]